MSATVTPDARPVLGYVQPAALHWLQGSPADSVPMLTRIARTATPVLTVPLFLDPPPGAGLDEPLGFVQADLAEQLQRMPAQGETLLQCIRAAAGRRGAFTTPLYGPAGSGQPVPAVPDRAAVLEAALVRLLDSDPDSELSRASDAVLREASADERLPAVIREQAGAVLQARIALGRTASAG